MIYTYDGETSNDAYDFSGNEISFAYDVEGNIVYTQGVPDDPYLPNRLLVFEDKFNGDTLDSETWVPEVGYIRGDTRLYQSTDVSVSNGNLILTSKRDALSRDGWTQGSIGSEGCRSWMYGRFEAKMKCTNAKGAFPAFWCVADAYYKVLENLGNNDGTVTFPRQEEGDAGGVTCPLSGEIDIVEVYNENWGAGTAVGPGANLYSTNQTPSVSLGVQFFPYNIDVTQYHVYAMEWTPEYIEVFIDGTAYKRWTFENFAPDLVKGYTTYPFSILLSQGSMGSDVGTNEHQLMVDWVRVYAPTDVTQEIPVESVSIPSTFRLKKGYKKYMVANITPKTATNRHLSWNSSNNNVVRVEHGLMYGINYGEATLTAVSDNGKTASCTVTVVDEY